MCTLLRFKLITNLQTKKTYYWRQVTKSEGEDQLFSIFGGPGMLNTLLSGGYLAIGLKTLSWLARCPLLDASPPREGWGVSGDS